MEDLLSMIQELHDAIRHYMLSGPSLAPRLKPPMVLTRV